MKISCIQKPVGSLEILVHLHRNEKATISNLISEAGLNQRTTYSALARLQNLGLVSQKVVGEFPVSKYYGLTRKGKMVAMHLDTIEGMLAKRRT